MTTATTKPPAPPRRLPLDRPCPCGSTTAWERWPEPPLQEEYLRGAYHVWLCDGCGKFAGFTVEGRWVTTDVIRRQLLDLTRLLDQPRPQMCAADVSAVLVLLDKAEVLLTETSAP